MSAWLARFESARSIAIVGGGASGALARRSKPEDSSPRFLRVAAPIRALKAQPLSDRTDRARQQRVRPNCADEYCGDEVKALK